MYVGLDSRKNFEVFVKMDPIAKVSAGILVQGYKVYKSSFLNANLWFLFNDNKTGFLYPDHYLRVCY